MALLGIRATRPSGTYFEVTKHPNPNLCVSRVHEFYVEEPEPGTLMRVAIDVVLDDLDPYTVYYPESSDRRPAVHEHRRIRGHWRVGPAHRGEDDGGGGPARHPAHEAGIRPGDVVREVAGRSVDADMDTEEVGDLLQGVRQQCGHRGDRPYGGGRLEFEVERAKVRIPAVTYSGRRWTIGPVTSTSRIHPRLGGRFERP